MQPASKKYVRIIRAYIHADGVDPSVAQAPAASSGGAIRRVFLAVVGTGL